MEASGMVNATHFLSYKSLSEYNKLLTITFLTSDERFCKAIKPILLCPRTLESLQCHRWHNLVSKMEAALRLLARWAQLKDGILNLKMMSWSEAADLLIEKKSKPPWTGRTGEQRYLKKKKNFLIQTSVYKQLS
jgi:hypothetical protein